MTLSLPLLQHLYRLGLTPRRDGPLTTKAVPNLEFAVECHAYVRKSISERVWGIVFFGGHHRTDHSGHEHAQAFAGNDPPYWLLAWQRVSSQLSRLLGRHAGVSVIHLHYLNLCRTTDHCLLLLFPLPMIATRSAIEELIRRFWPSAESAFLKCQQPKRDLVPGQSAVGSAWGWWWSVRPQGRPQRAPVFLASIHLYPNCSRLHTLAGNHRSQW